MRCQVQCIGSLTIIIAKVSQLGTNMTPQAGFDAHVFRVCSAIATALDASRCCRTAITRADRDNMVDRENRVVCENMVDAPVWGDTQLRGRRRRIEKPSCRPWAVRGPLRPELPPPRKRMTARWAVTSWLDLRAHHTPITSPSQKCSVCEREPGWHALKLPGFADYGVSTELVIARSKTEDIRICADDNHSHDYYVRPIGL